MLVSDPITRARVLLADQKKQRFTDAEMISELNAIFRESCAELGWYRQEAGLAVCEDRIRYTLPDDLIRLRAIHYDQMLTGSVIMAMTYKDALVTSGFSRASDLASQWNFSFAGKNNRGTNIFYKDTVSYNEFLLDPAVSADDSQPDVSQLPLDLFWAP